MASNPFAEDVTNNIVVTTLKAVPDMPSNEAAVGMVAKQGGDVGMEAHAEKDFKDGMFVEANASWLKKAGWSAAAWFGWKGK